MQLSENKKKTTFALLPTILLLVSIILTVTPVNAQLTHLTNPEEDLVGYPDLNPLPSGVTPTYTIETVAYMSFRPQPAGLNQPVLVNIWSSPGMYHSFYMCDYVVDIERPDGSTFSVEMNSYMGDATMWFEFSPDQVGTWKLKFSHPGTYLPAGIYDDRPGPPGGFFDIGNYTLNADVWYTPSETDVQELEVVDEIILSYPLDPLPEDYWTRPISPQHRGWVWNTGNYPWTGQWFYNWPEGRILYASNYKYTAYVTAPDTAHIVWTELQGMGGLMGAEQGYNYRSGSTDTFNIVCMGRAYGTHDVWNGTEWVLEWRCVDIRTGEEYWSRPVSTTTVMGFFGPSTTALTPSCITNYGSAGFGGTTVELLGIAGGRLYKWNPETGDMTLNVSAMAASTSAGGVFGGGGAIFSQVDPWVLSVQNLGNNTNPEYRLINWTTEGSTSTFENRVLGNISWPRSNLGLCDFDAMVAVTCDWANPPGPQWCIGHEAHAVNILTGVEIWSSFTNDTIHENVQSGSSVVADRGKMAFGAHGRHWTAYYLEDGVKAWESELFDYPWGAWYPYATASYDFNETKGAIITSTYEGVYAVDWDNGDIVWHYSDPDAVPFENPYTTEDGTAATPFFTSLKIADGKVFIANTEHTPTSPVARDWKLHCIDANTGEGLWRISIPSGVGVIADGYCTVSSSQTGTMYVFGKGESETTVTAPDTEVPLGENVLIRGTVLDMSPAQPGTPCVAPESMQQMMEYIHLQFPIGGIWRNETLVGVPVELTAVDKEGGIHQIGTAVTNGEYGTFSMAWEPPAMGKYEIIASFAGDGSYGSSGAATAVYVGPAPSAGGEIEPETPPPTTPPPTTPPPTTPPPTTPPPTTPPPTTPPPTTPPPSPEAPFPTTEVAIVAVVLIAIIIGIAAYWTLRKSK
jgi:hypothetical protein